VCCDSVELRSASERGRAGRGSYEYTDEIYALDGTYKTGWHYLTKRTGFRQGYAKSPPPLPHPFDRALLDGALPKQTVDPRQLGGERWMPGR